MDHPITVPRVGATLLIGASTALGSFYAYKLGSHFGSFVGVAFGAMALGGEILKPFAVERAFSAGRQGCWRRAACLAVAGVAIAYSITAELGFSAGARGDLTAGRAAEIKSARDAQAAAKRAGDELALLKPARPVGELEALIAGFKPQCRMVVTHGFRGDVCSKPTALQAELGRAKRRAELEAAIAEAAKVGAGVADADPQAAALVAYLAAAGVEARPERVATWLHLLPVLLLEIGSAFGLLVAGGLEREASPARLPERVPASVTAPPARVPVPKPLPANVASNVVSLAGKRRLGPMARRQTSGTPDVPGSHPVLEALSLAGRPLTVTELAAAMGVSAGEASKRWQEVEDRLQVGWQGRCRAIALRAS